MKYHINSTRAKKRETRQKPNPGPRPCQSRWHPTLESLISPKLDPSHPGIMAGKRFRFAFLSARHSGRGSLL